MKIHIHRGQDQIGGSIIEISTATTRLIFDVGTELDESDQIEVPAIDGLFVGIKKYDAVFISHYHPDHIGLLGALIDDIPVYMGEKAFDIFMFRLFIQKAGCTIFYAIYSRWTNCTDRGYYGNATVM